MSKTVEELSQEYDFSDWSPESVEGFLAGDAVGYARGLADAARVAENAKPSHNRNDIAEAIRALSATSKDQAGGVG